ncbi:MAG: precorrin-6A synthase (deacetylating) [Pseudomonadota bacterium]
MLDLRLIGIGAGAPDHVTRQGEAAIRSADLILLPRKGDDKSDLAELRLQIIAAACDAAPAACAAAAPTIAEFDMPVRDPALPYLQRVERWHDAIAERWTQALAAHPGARSAALLVWGDPSLYDSTLRIAARLRPAPRLTVVPGITALQALTAAHAVPLNTVGDAVVVTTGRRLRDQGWPEGARSLAVMLDGACAFQTLPAERFDIWWGANLGLPSQVLRAGPLADLAQEIPRLREAARAGHGWIMDVYLLRLRDG